MKKRLISFLLALMLTFSLTACGGSAKSNSADTSEGTPATFPYVTSSIEYTLYQNIFSNDLISDYDGESMTKTGTLATIHDSFSGVDRYYVWGYYDETKCCDWQWEFIPAEGTKLPPNGSLVEVSGTFTADENALDGCWLTDTSLSVKQEWQPSSYDVDMSVMNATLERVQLVNMQYYPDQYENQTVCGYGRVESTESVQHPYYDGAWTQSISSAEAMPAIGTPVLFTGTFSGGIITEAVVEPTSQY